MLAIRIKAEGRALADSSQAVARNEP